MDDDAWLEDHLAGVLPDLVFATDGLALPREPTPADVRALMAANDAEMGETTRAFYRAKAAVARASKRWHLHLDRTLVSLADASAERRGALPDREAKARRTRVAQGSDEFGEDLWATWEILVAHAEAVREHLYTLRSRASTLQSMLRSVEPPV